MIETPQSFVTHQECEMVTYQNGYSCASGERRVVELVQCWEQEVGPPCFQLTTTTAPAKKLQNETVHKAANEFDAIRTPLFRMDP
jgi:hypothetical protein